MSNIDKRYERAMKLYPDAMDLTSMVFGTEQQALEGGYLAVLQNQFGEFRVLEDEPSVYKPKVSYYDWWIIRTVTSLTRIMNPYHYYSRT